jgi:hypothetical protein
MMSVRRPAATRHGKHNGESGREITNSEAVVGGRNARRACGLRAYHDYSINVSTLRAASLSVWCVGVRWRAAQEPAREMQQHTTLDGGRAVAHSRSVL